MPGVSSGSIPKHWADRLHAGPAWRCAAGDKRPVGELIDLLGVGDEVEAHRQLARIHMPQPEEAADAAAAALRAWRNGIGEDAAAPPLCWSGFMSRAFFDL